MLNNPTASTGQTTAHLRPNWWVYLLNGILTLLFGIVALIWPGRTLLTLEQIFGIFAIITGVSTLIGAFRARTVIPQNWWLLLIVGLVGIIAGILAIAFPITTVHTFAYLMGAWALISGIAEIASFFSMRDHAHRWWLILSGIFSIIFGILAFLFPGLTLEVFITFIAVYAIFAGVSRIIFAFQMRSTT